MKVLSPPMQDTKPKPVPGFSDPATALKREMRKLKLETAMAERATETAILLSSSSLLSIVDLRKEIDDLNAEHVLVEIARLQAAAEAKEIDDRRAAEAAEFSSIITHLRSQIVAISAEIAAIELEAVKAESFELMTGMDKARRELLKIREESNKLKQAETGRDITIQSLNSKLLTYRSKLESSIEAEKHSRALVDNLTGALKQLKREAEATNKEKEEIQEEIRVTSEKLLSLESELETADRRLEVAIGSLRSAKMAESAALARLKRLAERTMMFRACSMENSAAITISALEHEYLIGHGGEARRIADKKTEAAKAWVEAFKTSESEINMQIEKTKKEMKEIGALRRRSGGEGGSSVAVKRTRSRARRSSIGQRPSVQMAAIALRKKKAVPGLGKLLRHERRSSEEALRRDLPSPEKKEEDDVTEFVTEFG